MSSQGYPEILIAGEGLQKSSRATYVWFRSRGESLLDNGQKYRLMCSKKFWVKYRMDSRNFFLLTSLCPHLVPVPLAPALVILKNLSGVCDDRQADSRRLIERGWTRPSIWCIFCNWSSRPEIITTHASYAFYDSREE